MRKKELYEKVITYFQQAMPVAETELHYENPLQLDPQPPHWESPRSLFLY